jgi:hypothetical protein
MVMQSSITWPDGKSFAFTVFDDTDRETLENAPPVYEFLHDHGFRTTKSVWPLRGPEQPLVGGAMCEDPGYADWARKLQSQGFEIALHNVTYHTSARAETLRGLESFRELFGHDPDSMANHTGCREAVYWGSSRLTGIHAFVYNVLSRYKGHGVYQGHVEGSPLFWGDLCQRSVKYVRNFVFAEINTLKACPYMPYHDPQRPYVNYWFASSEGHDVDSFVPTISERNQDSLEAEGGACNMYTHFGKRFYAGGGLDPRFRSLMERLCRKNGWFVPVTTLLDYLMRVRGHHELSPRERRRLERKWLLQKMLSGGTS